ncbi:hypothetical protein E2C01_052207 [Portunus trituberculatus]|uniref:Uncharacterized protein n=1 Tax=Portunus trituberculatus TaxID=210409 RepID=A0A5B7GDU2_PORTR|nr:hypothetical protein [Portunus trituberculatus]
MSLGGDMGPNMGNTINKIACTTNGRKLNSASHTLFKCAYRNNQEVNSSYKDTKECLTSDFSMNSD